MTTKTDISAIVLTQAEISAACAHGIHPANLLSQAKLQAGELASSLGTLINYLPAGANKTALTTIQNLLL